MARSTAHEARNATFREVFLQPFEFKATLPPTAQLITEEARKLKLEHYVENIPASRNARIHWLGDRSAEKVLLYFHGGGFSLPSLNGHVRLWNECLKFFELKKKIVIAALEYGLTKETRYPVQIIQATEALRLILDKGYDMSNVVIGGDSAGANLALAVISVILHPMDGVHSLQLHSPLAGVLLISPWVSFNTKSDSWTTNEDKDAITASTVHQLAPAYVEVEDQNNYSEPIRADFTWWRAIPAKSILNVYGGFECFKSHIVELGEKLAMAGNEVENVECPLHVHIDCILDLQTDMEPGVMSMKVFEWLSKVL